MERRPPMFIEKPAKKGRLLRKKGPSQGQLLSNREIASIARGITRRTAAFARGKMK